MLNDSFVQISKKIIKNNSVKFLGAALVGAAILFSGSSSHAWGDMGHSLVGGLAEAAMTPEAREMVRGILGIEPLTVSATFPDKVRGDVRFDSVNTGFSDYHFCDTPVGYTYANKPYKPARDCYAAIAFSQNIIKDPRALHETKQIALRYLIHVVGDIHQPFHIGNGFDRGANACVVDINGRSMNLHSYWDEQTVDQVRLSFGVSPEGRPRVVFISQFLEAMKTKYAALFDMTNPQARKNLAIEIAKVSAGTLNDWIEESARLRENVYPDTPQEKAAFKFGSEYSQRPYCVYYANQETDKAPAPGSVMKEKRELTPQYMAMAAGVAEQQILRGSLRLAGILNRLAVETRGEQMRRINELNQSRIIMDVLQRMSNFTPQPGSLTGAQSGAGSGAAKR